MAKKNFKALAIDHVEKVVFGILALVALLAILGTQWTPYQGTPREITEKVSKGRQVWKTNVWPEEEQKEFVITQESAPANLVYDRIYRELSPASVEMSGRMVVDIRGRDEPVREPELVAVQNPIVSSGRVFLEILSETPATTTDPNMPATPVKTPPAADDNVPDEFRQRQNVAGMGRGGEGASLDYTAAMEIPVGMEGMGMEGMAGMEGTGPTLNLNGQGYHFVSVRGVFPLRDQILKYADAIHRNFHQAASIFDILDFELERQVAQLEGEPWTGPWEKVDLQAAYDILDKAAGFDAEVLNSTVTNAVITMPLPMRITGEWRRQATHPQIEKFELTDSQIAMETEMQRKLLQEAAAQKKQMDSAVTRRGGFARSVIDSRQLEADMLGTNMYSNVPGFDMGGGMGGMAGPMGGAGGTGTRNTRQGAQVNPLDKLVADMAKGATNRADEEKRIREWIQSRVSAEGELLLFRYLDFNVEPGRTYRYRIRLVLRNPNFGRRLQDAGGVAHVVEGESRATPWSQVTQPIYVEEDIKYFVTDIREQSGKVFPTAKFDIFEWNPSFGTFINSLLEVRMGQPLSDEVQTVVIDPAKGKNEEQKYRFSAKDYFVDAIPEIRMDDALHEKIDDGTAIKLPPGLRGKLPLAPQTLVAKSSDELVYLSPAVSQQEHSVQKNYMELQKKQFEYLKAPKVDESASALAELGLAPGAEGAPEGKSSRQKSALKRKSRGSDKRGEGMMGP